MSLLGDALGLAKHVGEDGWNGVKGAAEDGYKLATDSHYREQAWNSALDDAKAAANFAQTAVRSDESIKQQFGSWIDSGEKYLENKVDEGRAWLSQHGGVAGQAASDWIGFQEGVGASVYGAGKGLVQLADGAQSLTNPIEWAANPGANVARLKSTVTTVETLGKIAGLADPTSWMTDPQHNAQLAGALWHSATTSFDKDPAKFTGNVVGTIGTLFIPGADAAGVVADAGKVSELATDASKVATITGDISKAASITQDAGKLADVTETGVAGARAAAPLTGPVVFRAPPGATAEEFAQLQAYVKGSNEGLAAGKLSPTGRVSTAGDLRADASAAAAEERARAAAQGVPYAGHVGHVPDTTWTGSAQPYKWLDLTPRLNSSLGGQAAHYPLGYKPTVFRVSP